MRQQMLKYLDSLVDKITMYKLLIYYLLALLLGAVGLSIVGDLKFNPIYIVISSLILVAACYGINKILASIFEAPTNSESAIITGLILALIITPNPTGFNITFMLAASGLAMASKYILAINKKHIFNPAAIAVVLTAWGPRQSASWWVGTAVMLPLVLIGGILITRKIRRSRMVLSFFASSAIATIVYSIMAKTSVMTGIHDLIFSSSVFFLGFVMLTEPLTSPPTVKKQTWYAIIVGILLPPQAHLGSFYASPEIALSIGNFFSYIISPKTKVFPKLKAKTKIATNTADFIFTPGKQFAYQPGQYMEFTLPHKKPDIRGNRRYFTLASSPTEQDFRIGIKFYENGSSFKEALLDINRNTPIVASQIAGDFVMPKDPTHKLAFIAGGIGITPFRSMVKYLTDKQEQRDIVLLYSSRTENEVAYKKIFDEARDAFGLKTIYTISDVDQVKGGSDFRVGMITAEMIQAEIPDYIERTFYLSGTHPMVEAMHEILSGLGVHHSQIKIDFFPGYA
jgi:ferredoxin-NADP reductase/Na+-transporting NADH:ubiquinone oxidoreductase subunit NqrB